jgi:uncharacterized membrane protein YciS (DUF1049 family)
MRWLRRLVVLALFVAALVGGWSFAHRNGVLVFVDYLAGTVDAPLWAVLLVAFALGAAAAGAIAGYQWARLALTARRYRKLAHGLEEEVHQLRNLPLGPPDDARARDRALAAEGLGRSG